MITCVIFCNVYFRGFNLATQSYEYSQWDLTPNRARRASAPAYMSGLKKLNNMHRKSISATLSTSRGVSELELPTEGEIFKLTTLLTYCRHWYLESKTSFCQARKQPYSYFKVTLEAQTRHEALTSTMSSRLWHTSKELFSKNPHTCNHSTCPAM